MKKINVLFVLFGIFLGLFFIIILTAIRPRGERIDKALEEISIYINKEKSNYDQDYFTDCSLLIMIRLEQGDALPQRFANHFFL